MCKERKKAGQDSSPDTIPHESSAAREEQFMKSMKIMLLIATVGIYTLTVIAINSNGWNWPAVAINDLLALDWRTQFDFDLVIHLLLMAWWIVWREGMNAKAYAFGFLSIVMGGMFSFPYIIFAMVKAKAQPRALLLGVHAQEQA